MEEEKQQLLAAFDAFLSPENQARKEANEYLIGQLHADQNLFCKIFSIYLTAQYNIHRKLSAIILKVIVSKYFDILKPNIEQFLALLKNAIENTNDFYLFHNLSEIVYQVAIKIKDYCQYVPCCLILYQQNMTFLPFCFYLYRSIFSNIELRSIYVECLRQIQCDIIFGCVQIDDKDFRFDTFQLFCMITQEYDGKEKVPEQYQIALQHLLGIAVHPYLLNDKYFSV